MVVDETPDGFFAYMTPYYHDSHMFVFSLKSNQSWKVDTPRVEGFPIALSPKGEPRQFFLGNYSSGEIVSYSVDDLRNGIRTVNSQKIAGTLSSFPNRMAVDKAGTLYASMWGQNFITSWNIWQPFQENRFYQAAKDYSGGSFSFALDKNDTLWLTVCDPDYMLPKHPKYRILKAVVGAESSSPGTV
ncbi:Hypothetical predicted protein [Cloeon dipterum]|uniref:Uncharacterized protein n=1 Tax=Cloeon dipterum TaxID=197152 RepID=A0A8S1E848_9INSE|nr:Hypothetical predicted protein [Cloeon dipterum]